MSPNTISTADQPYAPLREATDARSLRAARVEPGSNEADGPPYEGSPDAGDHESFRIGRRDEA